MGRLDRYSPVVITLSVFTLMATVYTVLEGFVVRMAILYSYAIRDGDPPDTALIKSADNAFCQTYLIWPLVVLNISWMIYVLLYAPAFPLPPTPSLTERKGHPAEPNSSSGRIQARHPPE